MSKATSPNTVTLDAAIDINGEKTQHLTLRKPKAGEMRGLKLTDVMQMDVNALITLIPRIATPAPSPAQVADLEPADLTRLGVKVLGFFGDPNTIDQAPPTVN